MLKCIAKVSLYIFLPLFLLVVSPVSARSSLPAGFTNTQIATGFSYPTGLTQAPDGRVFVLEKMGKIKVVNPPAGGGSVLSSPLLSLPVNAEGERGLLGAALDGGYIYVLYINNSPLELRISRFTLSGNTASGEVVLLRSTQSLDVIHHAGTLRIGPDGKIWASIGNNGKNSNSQDLSNIHGKIIRINKDGTIPSDNPFYNQSGKDGRIWAYGFRNPFRFSFLGSKPIVGDVGQDSFEEINIVEKGGNYGWASVEGYCSNCNFINPLYAYSHNGQSSSVTGGFFLPANATGFPAAYTNAYYYGDYARGFIHYLSFDNNGNFVQDNVFDTEAGSVVDMIRALDGSLYYVTIADGTFADNTGSLRKIAFGGENLPPTVKIDATPKGGLAPLTVQFSSTGTTDPENDPLSYSWEFGDGSPNSPQMNPSHVYTQNGTYTATLSVSDGKTTARQSIQIQVGNRVPTATILTPSANTTYKAGQTISYSGDAQDSEDGTLPASAFSWEVIFHHDTHVHPFLGPLIGSKSGSFTIPDSGEPSPTTWYEIRLTVTDSKGLSHTVSREIKPQIATMTFTSAPVSGLTMKIDGVPVQTPYTVKGVVGFKRVIDVITPQNLSTKGYDFYSWSDGGEKSHTIITPPQNTTYTATFTEFEAGTGHIRYRVRELDQSGKFTGKFLNGVTAKLTDPTGSEVYTTATSAPDPVTKEDGWVWFSNVDAGTYGVLTYAKTYKGVWKQTNCEGAGTMQNAGIVNKNTETYTAVLQNTVKVVPTQIAYCKDAGLQQLPAQGNVILKVWNITRNAQEGLGYGTTVGINGVTVKLTDTSGNTVIKTATTQNSPTGDPGWLAFNDIPVGTYGIMAYKSGYEGFWRQTDCSLSREINVSIQNGNTAGLKAAWNNNIPVTTGDTTYCRDLGLRELPGSIKLRIREFDATGKQTGKFLNGITAKLTDPTGATVYGTTTSKVINGGDGWVVFDDIDTGNYAVIAYKPGMTGYWKQTTCEGAGTTTNATVQNANTEGLKAGWQNTLSVKPATISWCADIGLKPVTNGTIAFRVREFANNTPYSGGFINGAIAKLTTPDGNTVITTTSSKAINTENGWVQFENVPTGTYSILVYINGYEGVWKQTTCSGQGTLSGATIQNAHTEGKTAAFQTNVIVNDGQTTWCKDVALQKADAPKYGSIYLRIREFDGNGNFTGKFLNGVTAKLMDTNMSKVYKTATSSAKNTEDGWVLFDNVSVGTYAVVAYKSGLYGYWKQTNCAGSGSTSNATFQNPHTDNLLAGMQPTLTVSQASITWCSDIGLKTQASPSTGTLAFRVLSFMSGNTPSGFVNDATAKVVDGAGNIIQTVSSKTVNNEDGWVIFANLPAGSYTIYTYKTNFAGYWKQITCEGAGSTDGVSVQNQYTEGLTAASQTNVSISGGQITWCKDVGLKTASSPNIQTPTSTDATSSAR